MIKDRDDLLRLLEEESCLATWLPRSICDCYGCSLARGEEEE